MKSIKLIIFDLGGVLVELGKNPFPDRWKVNENINFENWLHNKVAKSFEKGEINSNDFANHLISDNNLLVSSDEVILEFSKWIKGLYPSVLDTIKTLRKNYKVAILSNTNEVHWPILLNDFGLADNFDYYFASHIIHKAKPDKEIYDYVVGQTNFKKHEILFFDDNSENIKSANEMGINGIQVKGFEAVKNYLLEMKYIEKI